MSHSIKIKKVSEGYSQADNSSFIHVQVEVLKDGESVGEKSYGYPLGTTPEEIKADLNKVAAALDVDVEQAEKSAALEEALKSVKAAESLEGEEVGGN